MHIIWKIYLTLLDPIWSCAVKNAIMPKCCSIWKDTIILVIPFHSTVSVYARVCGWVGGKTFDFVIQCAFWPTACTVQSCYTTIHHKNMIILAVWEYISHIDITKTPIAYPYKSYAVPTIHITRKKGGTFIRNHTIDAIATAKIPKLPITELLWQNYLNSKVIWLLTLPDIHDVCNVEMGSKAFYHHARIA